MASAARVSGFFRLRVRRRMRCTEAEKSARRISSREVFELHFTDFCSRYDFRLDASDDVSYLLIFVIIYKSPKGGTMLSRNLDKAMQAYEQGDPEASRQAHMAGKHGKGEPHLEGGERIKSLIYGGLDGIITTFAVVAGVAGAELATGIVLIMGFANLIADGISMAIGDYLSTQAENEVATAERARESWEVDTYPEGEKREMVELYEAKGIPRDDAQTMVDILSQHKEAWVDVMMVEELGIIEADESPLKNALVTFVSFGVFGFIPLLAYVLARFIPLLEQSTFLVACVLTGATLFVLGAQKVRITKRSWLRSGLEMLIIGGIAAAAAYGIGVLLRGLA